MTNESTSVSTANIADVDVLLPEDCDFKITRFDSKYTTKINITHRWPRHLGNESTMVIATTTMDIDSLSNLRLEKVDGQCFIINDSRLSYDKAIKFSVENEEIGHQIVKSIIEECSGGSAKDLNIPSEYLRINKIVEKFMPLIGAPCMVILSLSASFWLIFK